MYRSNTGRPVAVMFLGTIGAGKSALLSQIGGDFDSGVQFRRGHTTEIREETVNLDGREVVLMDVPGLFEPDDNETQMNAWKLTNALRKPYTFKLYFVLKATNRGPTNEELVLMSKVNECVRQVDAMTRVEFRVIVNQIRSDDVYRMYKREAAQDNFQRMFSELEIEGFSFDIRVNNVLMLRYDEYKIRHKLFADELEDDIRGHQGNQVMVREDIQARNSDVKHFEPDNTGLWVGGAIGLAAVLFGALVFKGITRSYLDSKAMTNHSMERPVAVLFLGNTGAGKSTLLSQIGGEFAAGVKFRAGYTKDIISKTIIVDKKPLILIDIPGLFEPNEKETVLNAKKLNDALRRPYTFKLYFILMANNRGPTNEELVLMSKVNECVRQVDTKISVEFRVIVNQIQSDDVYIMYDQYVAQDNFQGMFSKLEIEGFSFDIRISKVLMLRYDEYMIEKKLFRDILLDDIRSQPGVHISLLKDISATNKDMTTFNESARLFLIGLGTGGAIGAVGSAYVGLSLATRKLIDPSKALVVATTIAAAAQNFAIKK
ncbi:hypothetical protein BG011_003562 [Mortierella polycephala]|uniref:G domain-containing protein n=1 Tax=Mortierella polycephala TaxID=41804 RepID=A0A9P6Q2R7_9FUNG|nr:hypothetical protein BG011_003562 [Mortierella polycephala]